jgi:adenosylcobinamide-GDP ribazoletransferase
VVEVADVGRSGPAFPLVGAALGLCVGSSAVALADAFPPLVSAGAALLVAAVLTGGIHLDALADSADALGATSREAALRAMHDPNTGAFGTAAVALLLLIEGGALAELADRGSLAPVVAAFALSRAVAPALACALPRARSGPTLAAPLIDAHRGRAVAAVVLGTAIAVACGPPSALWPVLTATTVWAAALAISKRRLGGATGDALGAAVILTESACLAVATAG